MAVVFLSTNGGTLNGLAGTVNDELAFFVHSDTLTGTGGYRTVFGTINGGAGNDTIYGITADIPEGTQIANGGDGNDQIGYDQLGVTSALGTLTITGPTLDLATFYDPTRLFSTNVVANGNAGNDTVFGSLLSDTLGGGQGDDVVVGYLGADVITGGAGDDYLLGFYDVSTEDVLENYTGDQWLSIYQTLDGNDTINGGDGDDYITGGDGNDSLIGGTDSDGTTTIVGGDFIFGGDGNDTISGDGSTSTLAGDDCIIGGFGADSLLGDQGDDIIVAGLTPYIYGDTTGDTLYVFSEDDSSNTVQGGAGYDCVLGSNFTDVLFGGAESDCIIDLYGNDSIYGDSTVASGSTVPGAADGNDIIIAGEDDNYILGGNCDDCIVDLIGGNDTIYGSTSANSSLPSGVYDDDLIISGLGNDYVDGNNGDDCLYGFGGKDNLIGNNGDDLIAGDDIPLIPYTIELYDCFSIDPTVLIPGNDTLSGNAGDDCICGNGGNDFIGGGQGYDNLYGDEGNDTIVGGTEDDYIDGGDGKDSLLGGTGIDCMCGGYYSDTLSGDDGDDFLDGNGHADSILGGNGNDCILGGYGNDIIYGNVGSDSISGGSDNDYIVGGLSTEVTSNALDGSEGRDKIVGAGGNDEITGGAGFYYDNYINIPNALEDTLVGNNGNDIIYGGVFDNTTLPASSLSAVDGTDVLWGGKGNDELAGDNVTNDTTGGAFDNESTDYFYFTAGTSTPANVVTGGGTNVDWLRDFTTYSADPGFSDKITLAVGANKVLQGLTFRNPTNGSITPNVIGVNGVNPTTVNIADGIAGGGIDALAVTLTGSISSYDQVLDALIAQVTSTTLTGLAASTNDTLSGLNLEIHTQLASAKFFEGDYLLLNNGVAGLQKNDDLLIRVGSTVGGPEVTGQDIVFAGDTVLGGLVS